MIYHLYCTICKRWNIGWNKVERCCGEIPEIISVNGVLR
jgi:hypothetical protein